MSLTRVVLLGFLCYTDQDNYVVIVWAVISLNIIVVVVS